MGEKRKRSDDSYSEAEIAVETLEETPEKRQKVDSVEPCTPQPLTTENLALLEGKMPPKTPNKNAQKRKNMEGTETPESKTTKTKTSSTDYARLDELLRLNGIEMNASKALETETGKNIMSAAADLVKDERKSVMKPDEVAKWLLEREDQKFSNEPTFVSIMWRILVGETRTVKKPATEALLEDQEWMLVEFKEHGLRHKVDQIFKNYSVPQLDKTAAEQLGKALEKVENVTTPKPDLAYGLRRDAFENNKRAIIAAIIPTIAEITEDMLFPFLVIEFKSAKGDIVAATMQACRGGAALVYSMRRLREAAGLSNDNDVQDTGRMAFSVAMDPNFAEVYVHWAQKAASGALTYYMNRLDGFDLKKDADIPKLRSHINNILDWGILKRKFYITDMLAKIDEGLKTASSAASEK